LLVVKLAKTIKSTPASTSTPVENDSWGKDLGLDEDIWMLFAREFFFDLTGTYELK